MDPLLRPAMEKVIRLYKAAPDLLFACENTLVDPSKPLRDWQVKLIVDAIAEAKGE